MRSMVVGEVAILGAVWNVFGVIHDDPYYFFTVITRCHYFTNVRCTTGTPHNHFSITVTRV